MRRLETRGENGTAIPQMATPEVKTDEDFPREYDRPFSLIPIEHAALFRPALVRRLVPLEPPPSRKTPYSPARIEPIDKV